LTSPSNEHIRKRADGSDYRLVIADEAHALKTPDSARTMAVLPLLRFAKRAIVLTGTPMPNGCAAELNTFFAALMPAHGIRCGWQNGSEGLPMTYDTWCQTLCEFKRFQITSSYSKDTPIGIRPAEERVSRMLQATQLRRRKADVAQQLPDKWRLRVSLAISPKEMKPVLEQLAKANDFNAEVEGAGPAAGDGEAELPSASPELMKVRSRRTHSTIYSTLN
jgi:SWI/SNF-related matrix-associated actin-dependent regulator 1 of chromatin subfamily A